MTKEEIIEMYKFFQKSFESLVEIEELIDVEGYSKPIPKSMLEGFINTGIIKEYQDKEGRTKYKVDAKKFGDMIKSDGKKLLEKYKRCIKGLIRLIIKLDKDFSFKIYHSRVYFRKYPEIFQLMESGEINLENSNSVVSEYNVSDYFYAKLHQQLLFVEKQKYEQYQDVLMGIIENFENTEIERHVQDINAKIQDLNSEWTKLIESKGITGDLKYEKDLDAFKSIIGKYLCKS